MKREKLIKILLKLLKKQEKELKPHQEEGIIDHAYECWVLNKAIGDLEKNDKH